MSARSYGEQVALDRKQAIDRERRAQAILKRRHSASVGMARVARACGGYSADRAEDQR